MKKYFKDTSNFLSFGLALIPSILLFVFQPTDTVPYTVFAITVLFLFLVLWIALKIWLDYKDVEYPTIELFKCSFGKCLCKPNPYLSHHSLVSFFKNEDGFEEFLCNGYVETITKHGLVQIIIIGENNHQNFNYISKHHSDIIIKPTISIDSPLINF